jgi:hypothetical protein
MLSQPIVGELLGHTTAVTTECSPTGLADPIRAANDAIASRIADAFPSGSRGRGS